MLNLAMRAITVIGVFMFILGAEASADCATPTSAIVFIAGLLIMKLCNGYWFN